MQHLWVNKYFMHCHLLYPDLLISVTYLWYLLAFIFVCFCCLLAKYVGSIVYMTTDIVSGLYFILFSFNPPILLTANQLLVQVLASTWQQVPCCLNGQCFHSLQSIAVVAMSLLFTLCIAVIYSHLSPSKAIISPSFASDCARSPLSWTRSYSLMINSFLPPALLLHFTLVWTMLSAQLSRRNCRKPVHHFPSDPRYANVTLKATASKICCLCRDVFLSTAVLDFIFQAAAFPSDVSEERVPPIVGSLSSVAFISSANITASYKQDQASFYH